MAKISLRDYDREIERQIEAGHTDEAMSHCRYILQRFPKHIDTYRLLGKACLEAKRYTEASDVLQRVLSSVPDDFIAHLGMSLIREDEGDLDRAIWHMERAFEVQPANGAIQNELRRLYGRRDGLEPPKVHLTRGALARMYAKGNLYRQAIAEIRTALAEDPQRPDLQALLAQTYMDTNQRVEAVETCSSLLSKLPYCLVANQILARILPDTERASEAKIYRQRIESLDPYAAHVSPSSPTPEQVPDSAITLDRYTWTPGETIGTPAQPEWAATLGVEIGEREQEEVPDWLSPGAAVGAESGPSAEAAGEPQAAAEEENEIPDWLRDMETASESESPPPFVPESEEEPASTTGDLARGEIPDWLRDMAPAAGTEEEPFESESPVPDESSQEPVQPFGMEEEAEAEMPDWLRDIAAEEAEEGPVELGEPSEEIEEVPLDLGEEPATGAFEGEELPDWLTGEEFETPEGQEEIPEWLQDLGEAAPAETQAEAAKVEVPEPTEPEGPEIEPAEEQLPKWLGEAGGEEAGGEITESLGELEEEAEETPLGEVPPFETEAEADEPPLVAGEELSPVVPSSQEDEDAALAWLESLAARQGADEEELLTSPEERLETPPEWVQEIPAEEEVILEESMEPGEVEPEEPEMEFAEAEAPEEEIPDWLKAAQLEGEPAEQAQEIPDWLHGAIEEGPPEEVEAVIEEEAEAFEEEPEVPSAFEPEGPEEETLPDWLHGAVEEGLPEEVEAVIEEEAEAVEKEPEMPPAFEAEAPEEEALPEWLQEMGDEVPEAEIQEEEQAEYEGELPDWLQDLGEEPEEAVHAEAEPEPILGDTQPVQVAPPEPEEVEELAEETASEYELFEEGEPGAETAPEEQEMPAFDRSEEEAAMAWLEGLAAKQGAPEEELLTPAEERTETPPEWVQEIEAEEVEAAAEPGEELAEEEALPEPEAEVKAPPVEELPIEVEEEIEVAEIGEEEVAERAEGPAAELAEQVEEVPQYETEEEEVSSVEEAEAAPVEAAVEEEEQVQVEAKAEIEAPAEEMEPEAPERREEVELPQWLREFETEAAGAGEEPTWQPEAEVAEEAVPVEAAPEEEVGEEEEELAPEGPPALININSASLAELERIPGIGFTMAQNIMAHRETYGPFEEVEALQQVSGIGPVTIEELKNWVTVESEEVPAATEDPNQIALNEAREAFAQGDLGTAIDRYTDLIRSQQLLDEIVEDLLKAVDRHPVEISLYQALGDAYMRKDQLQEALDAYTKAEELLR